MEWIAITPDVKVPNVKAPAIYTEAEAKVWKSGWVIGWLTNEPEELPNPGIVYSDREAKLWKEGRDSGFSWKLQWHPAFEPAH